MDSSNAIEPLWDVAQEIIDETKDDYHRIKKAGFEWFTWGRYGHRLLFHWGFNRNPAEHPQLKQQFEECLDEHIKKELNRGELNSENIENYRRKQEKKFWKILRDLQKERNKKLINAVVKTTGIPTTRGYAGAVATIIYDAHLLGDYSTINTLALPKIGLIEQDLEKAGLGRLLDDDKDKSERFQKIQENLKKAIRVGRGNTDAKRAKRLNETIAEFLPEILEGRFKKTLSDKGITITIPQKTN
ncbi:MAG: hypothetical protein LBQ43_00690 [Holosporales bacterium]|nr:hypothetical protein [Holosporales bacterium]